MEALKNLEQFSEFTTDSTNVLQFQGKTPKWKSIVEYSLSNNKIELLRYYGAYRTAVVNEILTRIMNDYCPHCSIVSSGSTLPTSDYDINVSGPDSDQVVKNFNTMFKKRFGITSAEMFDTNLYGYPRLGKGTTAPLNFSTIRKGDETYSLVKRPEGAYHKMLNTHNQHSWALLKFVTCLNQQEITTIRSLALFNESLRIFDHEPPTGNIDADNIKYGNFLHKVKDAVSSITESKDPTQTDDLIVKYNQLVSHANYHAQETYFSTGPYMHIVAKNQMNLNVDLSVDEYMDSFIENTGFTIQHLNKTDKCIETIVDSSKYMVRALNAYKQTLLNPSKDIESLIQIIGSIYEYRQSQNPIPNEHIEKLFTHVSRSPQCNTMELRNYIFKKAINIINAYFNCKPDSIQRIVDASIKYASDNVSLLSSLIQQQLKQNEQLISNVKAEQSLLEKVTKRCVNYSAGEPYINWADALRFTVIIQPEFYVERVKQILVGLETQKLHVEQFKNMWNSNDYRGINVKLMYNNQLFELQFHTPSSYKTKMEMHEGYKKGIKSNITPAERPPNIRQLSKLYSHEDEIYD